MTQIKEKRSIAFCKVQHSKLGLVQEWSVQITLPTKVKIRIYNEIESLQSFLMAFTLAGGLPRVSENGETPETAITAGLRTRSVTLEHPNSTTISER